MNESIEQASASRLPVKTTQPFLALFMDMKDVRCLVIGAGAVAARKAKALLDAGAILTVIAPESNSAMQALIHCFPITFHQRLYEVVDLKGYRLVVAATDNPKINAQIAADAKLQDLLVNVVEPGHLSNAVIPAMINRLPLQVAIFSGGATPALVRNLQRQLEAFIPAQLGLLVMLAGSLRKMIKNSLPDIALRRQFWRDFVSGAISDNALKGDIDAAKILAEQALITHNSKAIVDIVDVGSGDPELLTIRGLRFLQQPDVVLYERDVDPTILTLIPHEVERIPLYVPTSDSILNLATLHALIVSLTLQGKHVACLYSNLTETRMAVQQLASALQLENIHCRVVSSVHNPIDKINRNDTL